MDVFLEEMDINIMNGLDFNYDMNRNHNGDQFDIFKRFVNPSHQS